MTPPWTPDANAQALEVSAAIAAARDDGTRRERGRIEAATRAAGESMQRRGAHTVRAQGDALTWVASCLRDDIPMTDASASGDECTACRAPLGMDAQTTGDAEAVTLCGACYRQAETEERARP